MAIEFTPEEEALVKGMPLNVAVGFIAARRGTDVRQSQSAYQDLMGKWEDLQKSKGQVGEDELRHAFQNVSDTMRSRDARN